MADSNDREDLLKALHELGGTTGNARLRKKLSWSEDRYNNVKNSLFIEGIIRSIHGRGETIIYIGDATAVVEDFYSMTTQKD